MIPGALIPDMNGVIHTGQIKKDKHYNTTHTKQRSSKHTRQTDNPTPGAQPPQPNKELGDPRGGPKQAQSEEGHSTVVPFVST